MIKIFIDWISKKIFGDMYYKIEREGTKDEQTKKVDDE